MKKDKLVEIIHEEIIKELGEPYYLNKTEAIKSGDLYNWLQKKPVDMPVEVYMDGNYIDFAIADLKIDKQRNKIIINLD
jgi:hypothetical protein